MKKLLLILLCLPMIGFCQFTDNFSDGDFVNNPSWMGDVGRFEVDTNFSLHLNDSVASVSSLVTQNQAISNALWEFSVRLDFSPSTNNYAKVYLVSDMIDLSGPLNGMYVKIGGQSGNVDDISLYTQTGTNSNEIIDGVAGLVSNNPDISVKVTRDTIGNWELFLDTNGIYFTQGTAFDNSIASSDYFGVYCKYTVTRSDKFWFDDFSVTSPSFILGCIDSLACNYNSSATLDDGSCSFDTYSYDTLLSNISIVWNGISLTASGDYSVTLINLAGCDSIVNLNLTVTNTTGVLDMTNKKTLVKITDMLGKKTPYRKNISLFYIYDDGTVEKKIIIE
jgi:hypothetical protein